MKELTFVYIYINMRRRRNPEKKNLSFESAKH